MRSIPLVVFLDVTGRFAPLRQLGREKQKQPKWFSNKMETLKIKKNIAHPYRKKRLLFKLKSCFVNKRQFYKLLNDLSGKVNSSKVTVLETVANSISQPNAGFQISQHLNAQKVPEIPRRQKSMVLFKDTKEKVVKGNWDNKSSSGEDLVYNLLVKVSGP